MRLGVSPAAAPTPTGVFTQRSEALFPPHWSPGLCGLLCSPPFVPFYLCGSVGPRGATRRFACLVLCHSESGPLSLSVCECRADCLPGSSHTPPVSVPPRPRKSSPNPLPVSAPPTGLDECFFFIYLVSDFLAIRFSVSSGCFFVFKLLLSFFWICEETQCVYLRLHLGRIS